MAMIGMCVLAAFSQTRMGDGRVKPIHFRHLHVHRDEIELAGLDGGKGLAAIVDNGYLVAQLLKYPRGYQLVDLIILRH
jgi:hypothetical protein